MSLSLLTVSGNVGKINDEGQTRDGYPIRSFNVARNEPVARNDGGTDWKTTWFVVTTMDEYVLEKIATLKPGDEVTVCGPFKMKEYNRQNGGTGFELQIRVASSGFFSLARPRKEKDEAGDQQTASTATKQTFDNMDEIPF